LKSTNAWSALHWATEPDPLTQFTQVESPMHAISRAQHEDVRHASHAGMPEVKPQLPPELEVDEDVELDVDDEVELDVDDVEDVELDVEEEPPPHAIGYVPLGSEPPGAATQA
jgi:hypothetical protein